MNPLLRIPAALLLTFLPLSAADSPAQKSDGTLWSGDLTVAGKPLPVEFRIVESGGKGKAFFKSPRQSPQEFPATVERKENNLKLGIPALNSSFEGTISEDGNTASGHWLQGKGKLALMLKKSAGTQSAPARSQLPKPPFPYQSIDVIFGNAAASIRLAGTLTLPASGGPHAAVILVSGSGPQDRDETLFEHKPFLVIADHLTRANIAVLRYDDRGVGQSGGTQEDATTADYAGDTLAAFDFLAKHAAIDPKRIGILGHSEGGVIAPLVASKQPDTAFVIHLAGPAIPGAEIVRRQIGSRLKSAPAAQQVAVQAFIDKLIATLVETEAGKADPKCLLQLFNDHAASLTPESREAFLAQKDFIYRNGQAAATPWTHHYIKHDPAASLRSTRCPILALFGGKDTQVEAGPNMARLREILPAVPHLTIREFPQLNHLFQTAVTGEMAEYPAIEETIAPEVLGTITDFIRTYTKP